MHDLSWQSVNKCLFTPDRELVANLRNDFTQVQINEFTRLTGAWARGHPWKHREELPTRTWERLTGARMRGLGEGSLT